MSYFRVPRVRLADSDERLVFWTLCEWSAWKRSHRTLGKVSFLLDPGQAVVTTTGLAKHLGLGRQVVRRCLVALEARGIIATSVRWRAGTVITINGSGAHHTDSAKDTPEEPTTLPTSSLPTDRSAEPVDGRAFDEVPPLGEPRNEPRDQPPKEEREQETGRTKISTPPPPAGALARKGREGLTDEEADLLATAEKAFDQFASPREVERFVETWRSARLAGVSIERVRRDIAWMAEHPKVRIETKSLERVFYGPQVRRSVADWDASTVRWVSERLREGLTPEQAAAAAFGSSCEPDRLRAYVLKVARLCAPPLRAHA